MKLILTILCLALAGCDSLPKVSYGSTRAGVQTISTAEHVRGGKDTMSGYLITFLNVGKMTMNVQGILPMNGDAPLIKFGMDMDAKDMLGMFK